DYYCSSHTTRGTFVF
nr:immunoglobulin light chain junction region [Macaca mulatta]